MRLRIPPDIKILSWASDAAGKARTSAIATTSWREGHIQVPKEKGMQR